MSDLINEAIDAFEQMKKEISDDYTNFDPLVMAGTSYINDCIDVLKDISSNQKKGKWIRVGGYATPGGDPVWRCSECGKGQHVWGIEHNSYGADVADQQWVSCPNCGIEMEGEKW